MKDADAAQLQDRRRGPPGAGPLRAAARRDWDHRRLRGPGRLPARGLWQLPAAAGAIALLTYVLLVRAFRSLLLPLKAVLLNLLSLAATYGLLVLFGSAAWDPGGVRHRGGRRDHLLGAVLSCSRSCSGCRWTTRCSSWPACGRTTTPPAPPTGPSSTAWPAPGGW